MSIVLRVDLAERGKGWVGLATQPFLMRRFVVGFA